jgi:hypothetical protein
VCIVAGAGAGIWTERGDRGSEAESGTQKKRKRNLKTRDFVSEQRQRGSTQKLEGAKYRGGKSARGFATD